MHLVELVETSSASLLCVVKVILLSETMSKMVTSDWLMILPARPTQLQPMESVNLEK